MDLIILGLIFATIKFSLICKFIGIRKALYWDKWIDLFFTIILPIMFHGTITGMILAVYSGLFLAIYLLVARAFFKPQPPDWLVRIRGR